MLILLPPSETKRAGGGAGPLDLDSWALPELRPQRAAVIEALVALSDDPDVAMRVLKLGPRQRAEVETNAVLGTAPTMAAVDRYTGVLFDALDASSLDGPGRRWMAGHVMIHSAPFGPVGALDLIPAYRLGAGVSLPDFPTLKRHWAASVTRALERLRPEFVLDLRSEAYVALGPVPSELASAYVRVVTDQAGGTRALNHFNKHAKGELVRRLAQDRPRARSVTTLLAWAEGAGLTMRGTDNDAVVELVVPG